MKMNAKLFNGLSTFSLAIGMLVSSPAHAQVTTSESTGDAQPGSVQASADAGIADIVVTAQRRAESLQKASVVLSVISS